jgi:hypothetical protein
MKYKHINIKIFKNLRPLPETSHPTLFEMQFYNVGVSLLLFIQA